ncbi:YceI family protein [Kiloniella majae]|uniref:YceI family protein n=1 Tax=Kiloniella majae TaxID=1938558 RepID=UPI000A277DE7|nr:YceI family protein [Kiloniella majae]
MSFKLSFKALPASLAALAMSLSVSMANAAEYDIDPTHSFINFKTKHLGFSWLSGTFNKISGTMDFDPAGGADQKVNIVIDTTSLDTNHAERDKHLRSPDFFDVEKFPTATFVSTGYSGDANGGTFSGDLTLHGVTKNVSFDVTKIGEGEDPWGGYRAGFEGSYTLKRSDFGMDFNLGPAAEEVEVDLFIEAIKKK